jgi:hypothetical protein
MDNSEGQLVIGSQVRVKVPTDHPEDPVGTVVMILNDNPRPGDRGGVLVQFASAGAEVHSEADLEVVPDS